MLVETIMTKKVICLPEGASVAQARKLMEENLVRSLPVVKDDMALVGIITQRDIYAAGLSILSITTSEAPIYLKPTWLLMS